MANQNPCVELQSGSSLSDLLGMHACYWVCPNRLEIVQECFQLHVHMKIEIFLHSLLSHECRSEVAAEFHRCAVTLELAMQLPQGNMYLQRTATSAQLIKMQ